MPIIMLRGVLTVYLGVVLWHHLGELLDEILIYGGTSDAGRKCLGFKMFRIVSY